MSRENKTNRTMGEKSIAGITQEAEATPPLLPHSDTRGIAEGVASEVEQHHSCEDVAKMVAVNIIRQTNQAISSFQRLLLAGRVALFKAPGLGTIHG